MSFQLFLFQLINGVGLGMIYFLLSAGLTLIFGLMRFVNFAHGGLYMLAAYVAFALSQSGMSFWMAILIGPLAAAAAALLAERILLRHTYRLSHEAQILITFASALLIQEGAIMIFGPLAHNVPVPPQLSGIIQLGQFVYPSYRLAIVGIAAVVAVVVWMLVDRTRFGSILRAGSERPQMVGLLGINVERAFSLTFALGAALAGLAGVLASPLRGVDPFMSVEALGIAFVVVVIGGLGTLAGALAGGLLIGMVQSMMGVLWPGGAQFMIYASMAVVLMLRPAGLFGRR
jgi:branched-chain amino acid transport system permease protein